MKTVMKLLAALAAVAGAIYVIATYGEQIVAWCKKVMAMLPECKCNCQCGCEDCDCEEPCDDCKCACEAAPEQNRVLPYVHSAFWKYPVWHLPW